MQFRQVCLTLVLALTTICAAATAAPVKFDIPAQPAPAALMTFAKQARAEVVFSADDLKTVQTPAVQGELEPEEALALLLKDSGFTASRNSGGKFVVAREKHAPPVVTGTVVNEETGKPVAGAKVRVVDSVVAAQSDHSGRFRLEGVPAGIQSVVILADDYAPTRVTDVNTRAGAIATVGEVILRPRKEGVTKLEEYVVSAKKDVVELEGLEVTSDKPKPFTDRNVDIPRGIDDVQPYYIFDAKTLDQSGATNVEDFLKRRLTMNTNNKANAQVTGGVSNATGSTITLRGLSLTQTLILINGRRMSGVVFLGGASSMVQPDLNGIPLSAIDRIEVLPSSASAIYGASAIGGVVNVILKRDYAGSEVKTTYENTFDTDAPLRTVTATAGLTLEKGRTHVMFTSQYSDGKGLLTGDRPFGLERGRARVLQNNPSVIYSASSTVPPLGTTPNIASATTGTNLTLKDGTPLGATFTSIPAGISPTTSAATLAAGLLANAGRYNLTSPLTSQYPNGQTQQMGAVAGVKSFGLTLRREMTPKLEAFAEFSYNSNFAFWQSNPFYLAITVPSTAPTNPFQQAVRISIPVDDSFIQPFTNNTISRLMTNGITYRLPGDWRLEADYTWSETSYTAISALSNDSTALAKDIAAGTVNPFVDTLAFRPALAPFVPSTFFTVGRSSLNDASLRVAGPLWRLPAGAPTLAVGLEHRKEGAPDVHTFGILPITVTSNSHFVFVGRSQSTVSLYAEVQVPVIAPASQIPAVRQLDLQLAGRSERYSVGTGTSNYSISSAGVRSVATLTSGRASYSSTNPTAGFRYKPVEGLMLRASYSTGFLAPTYTQLAAPVLSTFPSTVTDPKRGGASTPIYTLSGGNPNVTPEKSESWAAGIVFEPAAVKGLRFDLEWYKISKQNMISSLSAQDIVDNESVYPDRVIRNAAVAGDSYSVGTISQVNTSTLNLTRMETSGFDLSVNYRRETSNWGAFDFAVMGTLVDHYKTQSTLSAPLVELANYVNSSGPLKFKTNGSLTWGFHSWTAGWATEFYGSYRVSGPPVTTSLTALQSQGSDHVASQMYHTAFVSYKTPSGRGRILQGLELQFMVKNVFNTEPPFDASTSSTYYSYFGDPRLRSYVISVRKTF
jgi:outer membrane receptor protein involved in Fe transport